MTFVITPALLSACSLGRNSGWPGCRAHSDPGAGQFGTDFRIEHSLAGWQAFRDQVKAYPALAVALETNQGTAVDQLLQLDCALDPVNPLSAKSYRERKAPSGHKTDRLDAWSLAEALRLDGQHWKCPAAAGPTDAAMATVVARRDRPDRAAHRLGQPTPASLGRVLSGGAGKSSSTPKSCGTRKRRPNGWKFSSRLALSAGRPR